MKSHLMTTAASIALAAGLFGAALAADQGAGSSTMKGDEMAAGAQVPASPAQTDALPAQAGAMPASAPTGAKGLPSTASSASAWNSEEILAHIDDADKALAHNRTHAALDATGRAEIAVLNAQQLGGPGSMAGALAALKDAHDNLQGNNKPAARESIKLAKAEISGQGAPSAPDTNSSVPNPPMPAPADTTAMPAEGGKNAPSTDEMPATTR